MPVLQISAVCLVGESLDHDASITLSVNNVNRYYAAVPKGSHLFVRYIRFDLWPRQTLSVHRAHLLTALNLLNYIDRSVLFAVQPLVQSEFHRSDSHFGLLTSAFFIFYMCAAPFMGPLADRYSRKKIIILGAVVWSVATLLTAVTYNFRSCCSPHLVGIGEASFVTISPTFVADLFPEKKRGRVFGVFYLALPFGTALGYLLGGIGPALTDGARLFISRPPGFCWRLALLFIPEPKRGQFDTLKKLPSGQPFEAWRAIPLSGHTLGMAMMTFSLGGIQVWMPTFLSRVHGYSLECELDFRNHSRRLALSPRSPEDGWEICLLPREAVLSGFRGQPGTRNSGHVVALFMRGTRDAGGHRVAAFLLLLNTSPLNAALINSVGAHVRATAIAVNIFIFHLLGDVPSPTLIGYVADRHSLRGGLFRRLSRLRFPRPYCFTACDSRRRSGEWRSRLRPHVRDEHLHWADVSLDCRQPSGPGLVFPHSGSRHWHAQIADVARRNGTAKPATANGESAHQHHCSGRNEENTSRHAREIAGARLFQLRNHRG